MPQYSMLPDLPAFQSKPYPAWLTGSRMYARQQGSVSTRQSQPSTTGPTRPLGFSRAIGPSAGARDYCSKVVYVQDEAISALASIVR